MPRLLGPDPGLSAHIDRLGPLPRRSSEVIDLVEQSGLRGRGGAGFPTARKMRAVLDGPAERVVVANGTEGEPMSAKDKTLLLRSPHLVLDGVDTAAWAVGATRRIVCIERGNREVRDAVLRALAERRDTGVEVVLTPRRYVSGQETALCDLIDGGPGRPTLSRPFESGVGGRPTLLDNAETLAQLALIARFGAAWYRSVGTEDDPGTALVTVGGAVARPGVYEVAHGTPLSSLLEHTGAPAPRAVLVGGYYGRWLGPSDTVGLELERSSLNSRGASLGCGVIAVIDDRSCAVAELARVAAWYAASSAGQCGACTWGLRDLASATSAVSAGSPDPAALSDIRRWSGMVRGRGGCRLPDGAATFLESGIDVFAEEIAEHRAGRCRRIDHHHLPTPEPEAWS
jgi:NADH:ubiquinone oxidoreductase subunit F (NADH-binding)